MIPHVSETACGPTAVNSGTPEVEPVPEEQNADEEGAEIQHVRAKVAAGYRPAFSFAVNAFHAEVAKQHSQRDGQCHARIQDIPERAVRLRFGRNVIERLNDHVNRNRGGHQNEIYACDAFEGIHDSILFYSDSGV